MKIEIEIENQNRIAGFSGGTGAAGIRCWRKGEKRGKKEGKKGKEKGERRRRGN